MRLRNIALCLMLFVPCGGQADTISADQAKALQQQIKDWLSGLLGPTIPVSNLPFQIIADGDRYKLTMPLPDLGKGQDAAVTASLRPLDGGRWSIEDVRAPDSATFTATVPETGDIKGGPVKVVMSLGKQDSHALIDPAMTTKSAGHVDLGDMALVTDSAKEHQEQHIDRYLVDTSLAPTKDGRLDLLMDADMQGWKSAATTEGGTAIAIAARSMRASGKVEGINRDQVTTIMTATSALIGALPPDTIGKGAQNSLPEPARAQLRKMVEGLRDVLQAVKLEETVEGLQVEVAGMGGVALERVVIGFGGEAPDGKLHTWFDIGVDGLDIPTLPPKITAYLPRHVALRPSLSGIQTADLSKLLLDATDKAADKLFTPDIAAIFAHGGIDVGLETFAFDLGPAKVDGVGHISVLSPDKWRGQARLTATGLDDLADQARTSPELQEALPILIMLRGLARQDGQKLVWDIASEGTNVTVNGMDLSQLGGNNDKPKGKPQPAKPGQQQKR